MVLFRFEGLSARGIGVERGRKLAGQKPCACLVNVTGASCQVPRIPTAKHHVTPLETLNVYIPGIYRLAREFNR